MKDDSVGRSKREAQALPEWKGGIEKGECKIPKSLHLFKMNTWTSVFIVLTLFPNPDFKKEHSRGIGSVMHTNSTPLLTIGKITKKTHNNNNNNKVQPCLRQQPRHQAKARRSV